MQKGAPIGSFPHILGKTWQSEWKRPVRITAKIPGAGTRMAEEYTIMIENTIQYMGPQ
ncbi:MAG: hypothetical protein K2K74_18845 [Lachnospiraceae bacterium]|nr:hypothetical protein [Lachnospiraceae bacterium]